MNPITHDALKLRWQALAANYCRDNSVINRCFDDISARYSESHRAYHTLEHLHQLFMQLENISSASGAVSSDAIAFAVWYHDIIYKAGARNNEANSATVAGEALTLLAVPESLQQRVKAMIEATQHHQTDDAETQLFLDADMAILGAPAAEYRRYNKQLAIEFKKVPQLLYKRGRKRFIEKTLAEQKIFKTDGFNQRYEQQARENLYSELARMTAR